MGNLLNFKGRILLVSISLLALSMAILATISYRQLATLNKETVNSYAFLQMSSNAHKIRNYISQVKDGVDKSAEFFAHQGSEAEILQRLESLARVSPASAIIVGFEDGSAYSSNKGKYNPDEYDPRSRGWYTDAKSTVQTIVSDIYIGSISGKIMVTVAKPFYQGEQLRGVLSADIYLQDLDEFVAQAADFEGANAALYDESGLAISSTLAIDVPGKSRLSDNKDMAVLTGRFKSSEQGNVQFSLNGVDQVVFYEALQIDSTATWYMVVMVERHAIFAVLNTALTSSVLTTLLMIVLSTVAIYFALSYAYRPVLSLKHTINGLASGNGDLTKRLHVTRNDDLGDISRDINRFIENLQRMMLDISKASQNIGDSVANLQKQSEENSLAMDTQKLETVQVVSALDQMRVTSDEVAKNTSEAAEFTGNTNVEAIKSKQLVSTATANVTELVNKVEESSHQVNQMSREISNISGLLKVIGDIAEQTNLLALNAAIEAARAGEQGRGFAVVADEVRALASRTQDSTSEIYNTINRLNTSSQNVTKVMQDTMSSCKQAFSQTQLVVTNLDTIVASVGDINDLNTQIATAAEQQSSVSEEINRNMNKINDMVERVAVSSEQVNYSTSILASSNSNLNAIVGQFILQ